MKKFFSILLFQVFLFASLSLGAEKKTICLNMIVKNEKAVICRCLESVRPIIDYWVIVDTGSTDGTQQIIREYMKDIPGELYERPWVNFEHNRTEALMLGKSKADYLLIIDADEVLRFDPSFVMPELDKDYYFITTEYGGTEYGRVQLVGTHFDSKWVGVLHESLDLSQAKSSGSLTGLKNVVYTDGARSQDPKKYHKDAQILEIALEKEPNNARYRFYLAQSYRDAGEYELSIKNYEKRIAMGGWDQELFWSRLQIGVMSELLNKPQETITNNYFQAYLMRPTRAEPLYRLASYFRRNENFFLGYLAAKQALAIPKSNDVLFVEHWVYDYGLLLEYSICAYYLGKYQDALIASYLMLGKKLPDNVKHCVENNLASIKDKLDVKNNPFALQMISQN